MLGPLARATELVGFKFVNGIGSLGNFWKKRDIIARTGLSLEQFATIVHPSACLSSFAQIGPGMVLLQHVTVNARARVGAHVIVLPGAVISHDDEIGDYTCIASSATLPAARKSGKPATGEQLFHQRRG